MEGLDFTWNLDAAGFVGRKKIGKTHLTKQILSQVDKKRCRILDAKEQYKGWPNVTEAGLFDYNVEFLNAFLLECYKLHDQIIVLDDLDLFIKHSNESEMLANFLINGGTMRHLGLCWQAKRLANLDLKLLTESKFLIVGQGVIEEDKKRLEQAGFDRVLYEKEVELNPNPHVYILLDVFTHKNSVITGFDEGENEAEK